MSQPETVNFSLDQEVLSSDLNDIGNLAGKASMDMALSLVGGIDDTQAPRTVVRRGLNLTAGAGLQVTVGIGELMLFAAGVQEFQSQYKLAALAAAASLVIGPNSSGQDRVDLISAHDTLTATGSATRNIISLPSRVITPTTVNTAQVPGIVLTVTPGTPGANPVIPTTPAGDAPLWAVYVPNGASGFTDASFLDLRVLFSEWASGTAGHHRHSGFDLAGSGTNLVVTAGLANINGALARLASRTIPGTQLVAGGFAVSTEYAIFAVARGGGDPVGKAEPSGVVFVAAAGGTTVNGDGRPGSPINYFPAPASQPSFTASTMNALYLGQVRTDASGNLVVGGTGAGLAPDWSSFDGVIDPVTNGIAGGVNSFLRDPIVAWVNFDTIAIGTVYGLLNGVPVIGPAGNINFSANLFPGETRTFNTFYYVYARRLAHPTRGAMRQLVYRLSNEAPTVARTKPTPEVGFTSSDYLYVTAIFNNQNSVAGRIVEFVKSGKRHIGAGFDQPTIPPQTAATPTTTPVSPVVPDTAALVLYNWQLELSTAGSSQLANANFIDSANTDENIFDGWVLQAPASSDIFQTKNTEIPVVPNLAYKTGGVTSGNTLQTVLTSFGWVEF